MQRQGRARYCLGAVDSSWSRLHVHRVRHHARHHVVVHVVHDPQRTSHGNDHHHDGEDQCHHVPAALRLGVHVQEVHHVYHHLHCCKRQQDQAHRARIGDDFVHHQPERNCCHDHREDETD